jgi:microcystin-dependent protein
MNNNIYIYIYTTCLILLCFTVSYFLPKRKQEKQRAITAQSVSEILSLAAIDVNGNISAIPINTIIPTGQISYFGFPGGVTGENIPPGYLICDGSLLSRVKYNNLFSAIGTNFGSGDGTSTFNIPDLRGIFIRGYDSRPVSSGRDPCDNITGVSTPPSSTTTRGFGSTQTDALQNITGQVNAVWLWDYRIGYSGAIAENGNQGGNSAATGGAGAGGAGGSSGARNLKFDASKSDGAKTSVETRPKNVTMLACIRYF